MALFPSAKPHRGSRRRLGRNQQIAIIGVTAAVTSTGTTNATLTFNKPITVAGNFNNTVATRTLVSQTQVSPTVVTQVWSGNVAGLAWTVPAGMANAISNEGGMVQGASGTFP